MEQVAVIPACGLHSSLEATFFLLLVGFEEIQGPAAQGGEIFGSVTAAYSALVFLEVNIHHPMELVLDAPVGAHRAGKAFDVDTQAAQIVTALDAALAVAFSHRFNHSDALQALPGRTLLK